MRYSRAAVFLLAALAGTLVSILLSEWAYVRASDGIYLAAFPLVYLLIAMGLIATTLLDKNRHQPLTGSDDLSGFGALQILALIGAALIFAFFQQSIGSIPSLMLLATTGLYSMGTRSPIVLVLYSTVAAGLLFTVFSFLGTSLRPWPWS